MSKEADNAHDKPVNEYIDAAKMDPEYRILKRNLTKPLYDRLKTLRSANGASLWTCLKSGVLMPDSKMGIYACDAASYDVFGDLFKPMILEYFNTKSYHPGADYGDLSKKEIKDMLDLSAVDDANLVVSTRVRVARNLEGTSYAASLTPAERLDVEAKIVAAVKTFTGDELSGEYMYLKDIDKPTQEKMCKDHILFHNKDEYIEKAGMYGDWPNGRGAFYNKNKSLMIWVNEEDHMRIISMQKGNNLLQVYTRLISALQMLDKGVKVGSHKELGFLASCPTNLGTGLRASVHIKLPLTSALPYFKDLCKDMGVDIRGIHGEHTASEGGVYDISNKRRFGLSEFDAISEMARGVKNLIRIEKALMAACKK